MRNTSCNKDANKPLTVLMEHRLMSQFVSYFSVCVFSVLIIYPAVTSHAICNCQFSREKSPPLKSRCKQRANGMLFRWEKKHDFTFSLQRSQ